MSESISTEQEWRPGINPWLMITPVMLAIFMFVLDETISNVALTYIAGSMSVSLNESTWVLTSYLIASGIAIPLVAAASKLFGRKNYFMICTIVLLYLHFVCNLTFHDRNCSCKVFARAWRRRAPASWAVNYAGKFP